MKILFTIDTLSSGGKERRLTELIHALSNRRDLVIELALMSHDIHYDHILDLNITVHKIIRRTKKDPAVFMKFYKLIKSCKPDIVHCWDSMTAVYVAPACKLMSCKLVNGMVIDAPIKQNILNKHWLRGRLTFPFSDAIIGNSEAGLNAYKAPEKKKELIYNGFNFDRLTDISDRAGIREQLKIDSAYVVGMVARYSTMKDYPTFFRAAELLLRKRRDITFIAIGAGTDSEEATCLIKNQDNAFFRLLGERTNVESFVNTMDICVLSTFTEGISNSILEYMALAKPVIATEGGGTAEIVMDKETGFLIKKSDPEELAERIDMLLNDPSLREKMGSHGLERIKNRFSIEMMVSKYMSIYSKLLAL